MAESKEFEWHGPGPGPNEVIAEQNRNRNKSPSVEPEKIFLYFGIAVGVLVLLSCLLTLGCYFARVGAVHRIRGGPTMGMGGAGMMTTAPMMSTCKIIC